MWKGEDRPYFVPTPSHGINSSLNIPSAHKARNFTQWWAKYPTGTSQWSWTFPLLGCAQKREAENLPPMFLQIRILMWLQRVTFCWNKGFKTSDVKANTTLIVSVDWKTMKGRKNLNCSNFLLWLLLCFSTTYLMIHHHYLFNTRQAGIAPNTMDMYDFYINSTGFTEKTLKTWCRFILISLKFISCIHTKHWILLWILEVSL